MILVLLSTMPPQHFSAQIVTFPLLFSELTDDTEDYRTACLIIVCGFSFVHVFFLVICIWNASGPKDFLS